MEQGRGTRPWASGRKEAVGGRGAVGGHEGVVRDGLARRTRSLPRAAGAAWSLRVRASGVLSALAGGGVLLLGACGPGAPEAPHPVQAPSVALEALSWEEEVPEPGPPPPARWVNDEILRSPLLRDPAFRSEVARWVEYWTTAGARWLPDYARRMAWFEVMVDSALADADLPPSLRYLPLIESGYSPRAVSSARAVGLWQFMAGTATGLGMEVSPLLDQRRDPVLSTAGAVRFLADLRGRFGSWYLALAAYNAGPGRLERVLRRYAPMVPGSDSLYWALRPRLPRETRDFVPKFLAAVEVMERPSRYGLNLPEDSLGFAFDVVTVPDATTLDVVARAAEVPQDEIERLNPQVVRGITPPGRQTGLRVPAGRGRVFERNFADIPPEERVTFVEHRVAQGETLTHIALRYGIPLRDLRAANPGVNPRRLQIGQRLTVPIAPSARRSGGAG